PPLVVCLLASCKLDLGSLDTGKLSLPKGLEFTCAETSPNPNDPRPHDYGTGSMDSNYGVSSRCVELTAGTAAYEDGASTSPVFQMRIIVRGNNFEVPYVNFEADFCAPEPGVTYNLTNGFIGSGETVQDIGPSPGGDPTIAALLEPILVLPIDTWAKGTLTFS